MKFIYSRVGGASVTQQPGEVDRGWLGGASVRGLPHRRAWVANATRLNHNGGDIWRDLVHSAPAPRRRPAAPLDGEETYILQQDPTGLWYVDPWGDAIGAIRPSSSAAARAAVPAALARDFGNTCFIIELAHATHP